MELIFLCVRGVGAHTKILVRILGRIWKYFSSLTIDKISKMKLLNFLNEGASKTLILLASGCGTDILGTFKKQIL